MPTSSLRIKPPAKTRIFHYLTFSLMKPEKGVGKNRNSRPYSARGQVLLLYGLFVDLTNSVQSLKIFRNNQSCGVPFWLTVWGYSPSDGGGFRTIVTQAGTTGAWGGWSRCETDIRSHKEDHRANWRVRTKQTSVLIKRMLPTEWTHWSRKGI